MVLSTRQNLESACLRQAGVQIADWNATGAEATCCSGATRPSAARVTVLRAGIAANGTSRRSASLDGITTLALSVICMELPANLGPYGGLCVYRSELSTIRVLFDLLKRQNCLLSWHGFGTQVEHARLLSGQGNGMSAQVLAESDTRAGKVSP
jgi:hypothetical protein